MLVLSLVGAPQEAPVSVELSIRVADAVQQAGARLTAARWLQRGVAWEAELDKLNADPIRKAAVAAIEGAPVDINVLPEDGRRKRLLIADMDSTMITIECIDELARELGVDDKVVAVTERAMRGELDFEEALKARVAHFAGAPAEALEKTFANRLSYTPGGRTLVQTMRANGAHTALVSGGFTFFTERVAAHLGFDENRANTLEVADGALTGTVAQPILGRDAKRAALADICARIGIAEDEALAVGDGANDLAMLQAAGMGAAYHAKPVVAEVAHVRLDHADLTGLLYLQGYAAREFVGE